MNEFDRRQFLQLTGSAALLAALAELTGPFRIAFAQDAAAGRVSIVGFPNGASPDEVARKLEEAILAVDDLAWLRPGDPVVIKVASNSGRPYPFTTHPGALQALVRLLKRRGAGEVTVADQAGIEWVAPPVGGEALGRKVRELWKGIHSGTATGMQVLEMNGLAAAARGVGAVIRSFDREEDWIHSRELGVARTDHWPDGFRVPRLAKEARHIINVARPSAHVMMGHTGTIKNWYGWLHPLDRMRSHTHVGLRPWKDVLSGKGLKEIKHLNERIAEVAFAFKDKVRLNLVPSIDTYVDVGPDWGAQPLAQSSIMASKDMLAADVAMAALVAHEKRRVPKDERRKNWRRSLSINENERFWGAIEGNFHDFHGARSIDALIDRPTAGGAWNLEQDRRARALGIGSGTVEYATNGVDPAYLGAITNLTGGQARPIQPTPGITGAVEGN
jgi:uncharacterized protein (DUF362 family)